MRLQSAIFDMDGTLLDSMGAWRGLVPELAERSGAVLTDEVRSCLKTMTTQEAAAFCKERWGLTWDEAEITAWFEDRMRQFYSTQVQLKPGVEKFLSLLKMEGVWMYVASATGRSLVELALRHTGIDGYFRGIITSHEVGVGKGESPEIFERAMRRLQSNKKDTVIFEDSLHAIRTAKAAGFRVAAVYDPSARQDEAEIRRLADYYITSFEEFFQSSSLL